MGFSVLSGEPLEPPGSSICRGSREISWSTGTAKTPALRRANPRATTDLITKT
jgi:hypothetical protein